MRKSAMFAAAAVLTLGLSACGTAPDEKTIKAAEDGGTKTSTSDFKACMVSDQGGFDDKSFNESGMEGMEKAKKELGVQLASAESKAPSDFAPNVEKLLAEKCNLIIGVGFMLNDAIRDAAEKNPDVHFALVDSRITRDNEAQNLPNAKPLVFNTQEAAYLAGYAAAAASKTGVVAAYGGMAIPSVNIFLDGFADGVARYNKDNSKNVKLLGWDKATQEGAFVGDFENITKGKELTEQQISQQADIIMPVAGPVGQGTVAAAADKDGVWVVGVDSDWALQYADKSNLIFTSVVKEIGQAVFDTIKESSEGKFSSEAYIGTIANGGVNIASFHDHEADVPAEVKTKLEELKKAIGDGSLKVETANQP